MASDKYGDNWLRIKLAVGAVATGITAVVAVPVVLGVAGFTGAGIAAGSLAAKAMSIAAVANGGGVAVGSAVAVLQSIGAAGLSLGVKLGIGSTAGAVYAFIGGRRVNKDGTNEAHKNSDDDSDDDSDDTNEDHDDEN